MKVYYDGKYNKYKIKDESGKEIIYENLKDIPYYEGDITEVEIEEGTTTINPDAFYDCESLKKVIIPNSVTEIGKNAFEYCIALEEIILPNNLIEINEWTFSHCESLKSITIPENVKTIKEDAFSNCTSLKEVYFPKEIEEIGPGAFSFCKSLKEISIPDNVNNIGQSAFRNCEVLKSVKLPKNITKINFGTFNYCYSLELITIPDNINEIKAWAFNECNSLNYVKFDNKMLKIYFDAFNECNSLDPKIKEELFYQIAKYIESDKILLFFKDYNKCYDSELIQELMTININFFETAKDIDKEVFLDAALDSIKNIYEKGKTTTIETDICNIIKKKNKYYNYYLYLPDNELQKYKIKENTFKQKINDIINNYKEKEEIDR